MRIVRASRQFLLKILFLDFSQWDLWSRSRVKKFIFIPMSISCQKHPFLFFFLLQDNSWRWGDSYFGRVSVLRTYRLNWNWFTSYQKSKTKCSLIIYVHKNSASVCCVHNGQKVENGLSWNFDTALHVSVKRKLGVYMLSH